MSLVCAFKAALCFKLCNVTPVGGIHRGCHRHPLEFLRGAAPKVLVLVPKCPCPCLERSVPSALLPNLPPSPDTVSVQPTGAWPRSFFILEPDGDLKD